jgi:hypothetical protein
VSFSIPKEPEFFTAHYEKGLGRYRCDHFLHTGSQLCGEATTDLLHVPFAAQRVAACAPRARLIALLRHPAERCFSHWWMSVCLGQETLSFDEAMEVCLSQPA